MMPCVGRPLQKGNLIRPLLINCFMLGGSNKNAIKQNTSIINLTLLIWVSVGLDKQSRSAYCRVGVIKNVMPLIMLDAGLPNELELC